MTIKDSIRIHKAFGVLVVAVMILFALFFLTPLYAITVNSFKTLSDVGVGNLFALPGDFQMTSWKTAWHNAADGLDALGLRTYFFNSVKIVIPAVLLTTVLGAMAGFVLSRWRFPGDKLFFGLILFTCFIPYQTILIPAAGVLGALHLRGSIPGLVLVHSVYGLGIVTLLFKKNYDSFPLELVQAAQADGAGFFHIFRHIVLPNSRPIIFITVIWQVATIWNDYILGAVFSNAATRPVTVAFLDMVKASPTGREYPLFAAAVISALPVFVIYVLAGRTFTKGLISISMHE